MNKKYTFFIVDDDPLFIEALARILKGHGQTVSSGAARAETVPAIVERRPDCIILGLADSDAKELQFLSRLRNAGELNSAKIVTAFTRPSDQTLQEARAAGANGSITRLPQDDTLIRYLSEIMEGLIRFTFWGVHGTLPVPGRKTARYGGNTPCVSLRLPGDTLFVFDAGTGIKELSNFLASENRPVTHAAILISHPHWDHIHGLPFFGPLYTKGNSLDIFGPPNGSMSLRELIAGQMNGVYFPINIKEFNAKVSFLDLGEEQFDLNGAAVQTIFLNHPGRCLGYRLDWEETSFCYMTDHELYPPTSSLYDEGYVRRLEAFIADSDVLITDAAYLDEEYEGKMGWGHSSVSRAAELADRAGVKKLFLFHHDLDQTDDDIDAKLETARAVLEERGSSTVCIAPKEGETFTVQRKNSRE